MNIITRGLRLAYELFLRSILTGVLIGLMAMEGPLLQMAGYGNRSDGNRWRQASVPGSASSPAQPAGEDRGEGSLFRKTLEPLNPRTLEPSSILSKLGIPAQAHAAAPAPGEECTPPDCIPLPQPITMARQQSAFSIDTLTSGELTITYRIFNLRDEEIGEPLLVTTLAPGVTLVTSTPVPDQPTPPDGRLAFVLPNIPPFGEIEMTLTVSVPTGSSGPVTVDDGARAFGNVRTRAVKASVAPTTLPQTLGVGGDLIACTIDTCNAPGNTPDRYVLEKVGEIGCDPVKLFEFARDKVRFESYRGSLRGARGTLWSMAGNALDEASMLIGMLRACGIPARYASGVLDIGPAQELILSMFPPITRAVGGLPPANLPGLEDVDINQLLLNASQFLPGADEISDPANDPDLLSETQEHYWVEYWNGSTFIPLDPTFSSASVGQTFTTKDTDFAEIDDQIRHKVQFDLVSETAGTGPLGTFLTLASDLDLILGNQDTEINRIGSLATIEVNVLNQTFRTVELVGEPVSLGHFVDQLDFGGFGVINTYSPWMQVGDREELIRGTDYQEVFSPIHGSSILTGLFLRMKTIDALGNAQDFERALVDRIGFAARQGEGAAVNVGADGHPVLTNLDIFTVAVVSGLQEPRQASAFELHASGLLAQAPPRGSAPDPEEWAEIGPQICVAENSAISATFHVRSHVLSRVFEGVTSTRGFIVSPNLTVVGSLTSNTGAAGGTGPRVLVPKQALGDKLHAAEPEI